MPSSFFLRNSRELMDTALGTRYPDLVVTNADLVNVYTREIMGGVSISVAGKRIAHVGESGDFKEGPDTLVIDAGGQTVLPGLIEGHTHLAWLAPVHSFLDCAAAGGTTTVITETLELYPIAGREGVADFLESLNDQPVKCLATAPAMASIHPELMGIAREDLDWLLRRDDIIGLGESYWQSVFQNPDVFLSEFEQTLAAGKSLEGHSAGTRGRKLSAYISLGISSCHEPINAEQVAERLRHGIHVMVREGSIRSDLEAIAPIIGMGLNLRYLCLVSDGIVPDALIRDGYLETIVNKAIAVGFDPLDAIRMASLNVAEHFNLAGHVGGIAPGRYADMLLVEDVRKIEPRIVIGSGRIIAENGTAVVPARPHVFKHSSKESIGLPDPLKPETFAIHVSSREERVRVRIIEMVTDLVTREGKLDVPVRDGSIGQDPENDLLTVSAIDRTLEPGRVFSGLIRGYGIGQGAVACTGAWDTADIIAVGADNEDMAFCVNHICERGGGIAVASGGKLLAELPLPFYGLFSDMDMVTLAARLESVNRAIKTLGCPFPDPLLTLQTLTGAAIPYLRICDRGLVDLKEGTFRPLECPDGTDG